MTPYPCGDKSTARPERRSTRLFDKGGTVARLLPARAVANVVTDLVDAWDDQEKPAQLARVNVVHWHRLAGNELPTERSSKPVAFAFACHQHSRQPDSECCNARDPQLLALGDDPQTSGSHAASTM
jgi:hypothetical protein